MRNTTDIPTAWFCTLERARSIGDQALELRALRELARLGVLVYWPVDPNPDDPRSPSP